MKRIASFLQKPVIRRSLSEIGDWEWDLCSKFCTERKQYPTTFRYSNGPSMKIHLIHNLAV